MAGKKINVTRREFQDSYRRHLDLYKSTAGSSKSRRLLLFYCVECGLKSLIMKNLGCNTYEEYEKYCTSHDQKELTGHNIKAMLKETNPRSDFSLRKIQLKKGGGSVPPERFNELWRYGAEVAEVSEENDAETTLLKIAEWMNTVL